MYIFFSFFLYSESAIVESTESAGDHEIVNVVRGVGLVIVNEGGVGTVYRIQTSKRSKERNVLAKDESGTETVIENGNAEDLAARIANVIGSANVTGEIATESVKSNGKIAEIAVKMKTLKKFASRKSQSMVCLTDYVTSSLTQRK